MRYFISCISTFATGIGVTSVYFSHAMLKTVPNPNNAPSEAAAGVSLMFRAFALAPAVIGVPLTAAGLIGMAGSSLGKNYFDRRIASQIHPNLNRHFEQLPIEQLPSTNDSIE